MVGAALTIAGLASPISPADASTRSSWDAIAKCESGGDWSIDTGNGYYGGLQFSAATWRAHGGRGSAAAASRADQITVGERVVATQGWEAWAGCAARLGLRGRSIPEDRRSRQRPAEQKRTTPRTTEPHVDFSIATVDDAQRSHRRRGSVASKKIAACTADTLRARYIGLGSAAGIRYADLELINTGTHRCRLAGASRTVRSAPARDGDRVGTVAAAAFTPVRTGKASTHPHLVLDAHDGHATGRIAIRSTADRGKQCRRVDATMVRGSSDAIDASLHGLRLQTCGRTGHRTLSLGHPRSTRPTTHR